VGDAAGEFGDVVAVVAGELRDAYPVAFLRAVRRVRRVWSVRSVRSVRCPYSRGRGGIRSGNSRFKSHDGLLR
jgi:hypothetical protein